jgi:hypothetical protein
MVKLVGVTASTPTRRISAAAASAAGAPPELPVGIAETFVAEHFSPPSQSLVNLMITSLGDHILSLARRANYSHDNKIIVP